MEYHYNSITRCLSQGVGALQSQSEEQVCSAASCALHHHILLAAAVQSYGRRHVHVASCWPVKLSLQACAFVIMCTSTADVTLCVFVLRSWGRYESTTDIPGINSFGLSHVAVEFEHYTVVMLFAWHAQLTVVDCHCWWIPPPSWRCATFNELSSLHIGCLMLRSPCCVSTPLRQKQYTFQCDTAEGRTLACKHAVHCGTAHAMRFAECHHATASRTCSTGCQRALCHQPGMRHIIWQAATRFLHTHAPAAYAWYA